MRLQDAQKLDNGDTVFWNDPDGGKCSRTYVIDSLEWSGNEIIRIQNPEGDTLECPISQLSPTVKCKRCKELCNADQAHLHQGEWIGDECCWDERLRASE